MIEYYFDAARLVNDPDSTPDLYHSLVTTVCHFSEVALLVGTRLVFAMFCSSLPGTQRRTKKTTRVKAILFTFCIYSVNHTALFQCMYILHFLKLAQRYIRSFLSSSTRVRREQQPTVGALTDNECLQGRIAATANSHQGHKKRVSRCIPPTQAP